MIGYFREAISLMKDLLNPAISHDILIGKKMFRPFINYQINWMKYFYPNDHLSYEVDSWFYLQRYLMPLIKQEASSYHVRGIMQLGLDSHSKPDFNEFQCHFAKIANDFKVERVDKEINPKEYFELIYQRRFPCIEKVRAHDELFCANEPDFWHEAVGHIAPLCFKEVQDFYVEIAGTILATKNEEEFNRHVAVAWTLLEYGFLQEQGQYKMFGAALVGAHLAHMRYQHALISIEKANRKSILESGFYEEFAPYARNRHGQFRFFGLTDLNAMQLFEIVL